MDIQTSKIELVKIILGSESNIFIRKLKEFVCNEAPDIWDELTQAQRDEVNVGVSQLNNGDRTSYEQVLKEIS